MSTKKDRATVAGDTFYFSGEKVHSTGNKAIPQSRGLKPNDKEPEFEEDEEDDNILEFHAGRGKIPIIVPPPLLEDEDSENNGDVSGAPELERGEWGNKLDFLFSCISVSVGLGNVWRFPYLCYKNGGGAFLLVYFIAMILCGVPIFFLEIAIGQYVGSGGMTMVAQFCPMLKGVGIASMFLVLYLNIYYCIIIAWTLFYLFSSFVALPTVPWDTCDGIWNTDACFHPTDNMTRDAMEIAHHPKFHNKTTTPVEEFWEHRVLMSNDGLEHGLGNVQYELSAGLFLGWVIVYLIIYKGLHASGKIIWFTALFPYFVLGILLVRAVTLEGAVDGLLYYIRIDWSRLLEATTWIDGASQIFFAYSVGMGALPALGSYNKFNHNCYRDALITCIVNTLTCLLAGVLVFSILGYMAHAQQETIQNVVKSGPGLVFITFPDLVLSLPGAPFWAALFFVMLLVLGVDTEFCNVEALVTGIVDNWPDTLLKHRRAFTIILCLCMFLCGLPMTTQGGIYIFQLMDFYSASGMSLLWVCFFQTVALSWFFGADKLCDCIEQMLGKKPSKFWYFCWKFFAPAVMAAVFIFYILRYEPVKYGEDYKYPQWAEILGLIISCSSMIWVPGYALYYLASQPGSFLENLRDGFKPKIKRMQNNLAKPQTLHVSESGVGLLLRNTSEYEMGRLHRPESFVTSNLEA